MRFVWITFGLFAHALFALAVCRLFPFLQNGGWDRGVLAAGMSVHGGPVLDAVLAVQFSVIHSLFLLPATREYVTRRLPGPQYGCFFCTVTCLSLLVTIEAWQPSSVVFWHLQGMAAACVSVAFLLSCAALFYSLCLTGLGYQTGWTPWWAWLRGRKLPRRGLVTHGAYRFLRHPIYLSFLGLIWLTPTMTLDRAVLTGLWTLYIFIGSYLKDCRLVYYAGDSYRQYQARVAGYPFLPIGPFGKVPFEPIAA